MAAKQQIRGRKDSNSGKKVSAVEAAYVVESYLIEKQFTKTLAEFRGEAASILSSLKNAPAVRSLTTILNDYVIMREHQSNSAQEKSRLEQVLRDEQMLLHQERVRMQSLVQGIHESLAAYQSGAVPRTSLTMPSMSSSPTHSAAMFSVGHTTPPGSGSGPNKTPGSTRAFNSATVTNKRKNAVNKVPQESPNADASTSTAATKKARQNTSASGPNHAMPTSPPWAGCGTVRKHSLNTVRVMPSPPQEMHATTPALKPHLSHRSSYSKPSSNLTTPRSSSSKQLGHDVPPQSLSPSPHLDNSSARIVVSHRTPINAGDEGECGQDPRTPPRISMNVQSQDCVGQEGAPQNSPPSKIDYLPNSMSLDTSPRPSPVEEGNSHQACEGPSGDPVIDNATASISIDESSPESCQSARIREAIQFKKVPSKTMRPLHFTKMDTSTETSAIASSSGAGAIALAEAPADSMSPSGSFLSCSEVLLAKECSEHSVADLELIDDILASLDETSFSELVGDMLGADICNADPLSSKGNDGEDRCLIGEDSFVFNCIASTVELDEHMSIHAESRREEDGKGNLDYTRSNCSRDPEDHATSFLGILEERDPNQYYTGATLSKCNTPPASPSKQSRNREANSKPAYGQENVPAQLLEGSSTSPCGSR